LQPPFDLDTTDRLLSTTRAVRRRLDLERPVDRSLILECIRLSQQAPTASNAQSWSWVVVDDVDQRARLGELYRKLGTAGRASARERYGDDPSMQKLQASGE